MSKYKRKSVKKQGGIYAIICNANNKIYIGSTVHFPRRKTEHYKLLRYNKHYNAMLQNAWNKYGEQEFEFKIIEHCKESKLLEREQYYIYHYNSCNKLSGFNLAVRADRSVMSDDTKEKLRQVNIGINRKYEHLVFDFISLANLGITYKEIAELFNVDYSIVSSYLKRVNYKRKHIVLPHPYIQRKANCNMLLVDWFQYYNFIIPDIACNNILWKVYKECFNIFDSRIKFKQLTLKLIKKYNTIVQEWDHLRNVQELTIKEIAEKYKTDKKNLSKFLREHHPGLLSKRIMKQSRKVQLSIWAKKYGKINSGKEKKKNTPEQTRKYYVDKYGEELINKVINDYAHGKHYELVGEINKISKNKVFRIISIFNPEIKGRYNSDRKNENKYKDLIPKWIRLRKQGVSMNKISKKYHIDPGAISKLLKQYGGDEINTKAFNNWVNSLAHIKNKGNNTVDDNFPLCYNEIIIV